MSLNSFVTVLSDPVTGDSVRMNVYYSMQDHGVMMCANEDVRPTILSVCRQGYPTDNLLDQLLEHVVAELVERALDNEELERALRQWDARGEERLLAE